MKANGASSSPRFSARLEMQRGDEVPAGLRSLRYAESDCFDCARPRGKRDVHLFQRAARTGGTQVLAAGHGGAVAASAVSSFAGRHEDGPSPPRIRSRTKRGDVAGREVPPVREYSRERGAHLAHRRIPAARARCRARTIARVVAASRLARPAFVRRREHDLCRVESGRERVHRLPWRILLSGSPEVE